MFEAFPGAQSRGIKQVEREAERARAVHDQPPAVAQVGRGFERTVGPGVVVEGEGGGVLGVAVGGQGSGREGGVVAMTQLVAAGFERSDPDLAKDEFRHRPAAVRERGGGRLFDDDLRELRPGADRAGVIQGAAAQVAGVLHEDLAVAQAFAGGGGGLGFDAQEDGDVLVAVEAVGDEEGHDDDVGRGGQRGPVGDERGFLHVGVEHGGVAAQGADAGGLFLGGDGAVVVERGAVADDEQRGLGFVDAGGDLARARRSSRSVMAGWLPTGWQ